MYPSKRLLSLVFFICCCSAQLFSTDKPKLTLDEFFTWVNYPSIAISPDGNSVVIQTERPDWDKQIYRQDLWLYRVSGDSGSLTQLTQSGHDEKPKWSPDGQWIAFLSDRKTDHPGDDSDKDEEGTTQLYLISAAGGEAFPVTSGDEEVHAFDWSPDSKTLFFSTRVPWSKAQKDAYKKKWKDVIEYRVAERGDTLFSIPLDLVLSNRVAAPGKDSEKKDDESDTTPGSKRLASSPMRMQELTCAPDGSKIAVMTNPINQRWEKVEDYEIYVLDLGSSAGGELRRVTHDQAVEHDIHWSGDGKHIFFSIDVGDVAGPYRDLQPHLYWADASNGRVEQWGKEFQGAVDHYALAGDTVIASTRLGTKVPMYAANSPAQAMKQVPSWEGTYEKLSASRHSSRVVFSYSTLTQPNEVYLAQDANGFDHARPITSFNQMIASRDLPQGKPYQWKAEDGTTVEGMLVYPPGKFGQKNLPMFTFIHGGPADADGNHFEADWYQWSALAATNGWLVFQPNYRGSTGYGDKFLAQIVPQIVSRPGKDILEGVDALVKEGIADPNQLAVGGYSYGGYMTNWLITQTTRFKAAVTGAGAVEHVANWGNDDTTFDDAYFLGGRPWEAAQRYHDEAAIFQMDKVRTPTHIVAGADDIRVAVAEDYLLEHALYSLGVPNKLLIFPGEGHSLAKNPWHEKIKVREELEWLKKYGGVPAN